MGGAPEEQSQGTQEQIVAEEVICTVDEEVFVAVRQHGRMCTENWLWLAEAQATARMDVPTAPIFLRYGLGSPTRVYNFSSRECLDLCTPDKRP